MKMAAIGAAIFRFMLLFQGGGGGRTRTCEGIASVFKVSPLCRSGHSPIADNVTTKTFAVLKRSRVLMVAGRIGVNPRGSQGFHGRNCHPLPAMTQGRMRRPRPPHANQTRRPPGRGSRPDPRPRRGWRPPARDRDGPVIIYGWHSVKAALENPARKIHRLIATENALRRLQDDEVALAVEPELVRADEIDELVGPDAVHQGLLLEVDPLPSPDIDDVDLSGI